MYLRDTLRLPAKGLRPSALPILQQPARSFVLGLSFVVSTSAALSTGLSNHSSAKRRPENEKALVKWGQACKPML